MSETAPHAADTSLLAAQLSLLEGRQADVADLLEVGGRYDEVLVDARSWSMLLWPCLAAADRWRRRSGRIKKPPRGAGPGGWIRA